MHHQKSNDWYLWNYKVYLSNNAHLQWFCNKVNVKNLFVGVIGVAFGEGFEKVKSCVDIVKENDNW
jgi:hypothetical protein